MLALGYSINLLTLLAMVLAIGLVVDDAIVVVENIHRHIEESLSPFNAALKGAGDLLNNVKYIITEGCVQPFYQGAPHIDDITAVLANYGFSLVDDNMDTWQSDELQGDFFFVRLAKQ